MQQQRSGADPLQALGKEFRGAFAAAASATGTETQAKKAALLARNVLWRCKERISAVQARKSFFSRITAAETGEELHLRAVQRDVARLVSGNASVRNAFHSGFFERDPEPPAAGVGELVFADGYGDGDEARARGQEHAGILRRLEHVSRLFSHVNDIVRAGEGLVERLDDRVTGAHENVSAGEREILEQYAVRSGRAGVSFAAAKACAAAACFLFVLLCLGF